MKHRFLTILAVAVLLSPAAFAGSFLVGASAGQMSMTDEATGIDMDNNDTAWKAFGGFDKKFYGVEAGYMDLGTSAVSDSGVDMSADITGFGLYAKGIIPVAGKIELFGKVGYLFWESDVEIVSLPLTASGQVDGSDLAFGAGAAFQVAPAFSIRLEYEQFQVETTDDVSLGTLGFHFKF